jgi:sugar phosphate isomerase/epimerase
MATTADEIPLSLAHLSELELPPTRLIEAAARAGFASVGLRTARAAPGGVEYPLRAPAEQAEVRQLIKATGVSVLYVEMISLGEATSPARHRPMLEAGAEIGATRLAVAGDSADFEVVAERMAAICDIAREYGIAVDLEFMPFRAVKSFADAVAVVRRADRPNAHVLVDALHVFRSGSPLDEIAKADRSLLGTFQLCDAPKAPPEPGELAVEARTRRQLAGSGGLELDALMNVLPADLPLGVEVPLAGRHPHLDPAARLALLAHSTREFLEKRRTP